MPRVTYLKTKDSRIGEASRACAGIGVILRGAAGNPYQLSKILHVAPATAAKKLKNPEKFTLEDLFTAAIALDISCEDIKAKIIW